MTIYEAFSNVLAARGYHYDPYAEEFRRGQRVVEDTDELLALVPGMTQDELAHWQDDKYEALIRRRARQ
jgi:hypothetical protein